MAKISVENRPRLGAANVFISVENFGSGNRFFGTADEDLNAVLVVDDDEHEEVGRFDWPEDSGRISTHQQSMSNSSFN